MQTEAVRQAEEKVEGVLTVERAPVSEPAEGTWNRFLLTALGEIYRWMTYENLHHEANVGDLMQDFTRPFDGHFGFTRDERNERRLHAGERHHNGDLLIGDPLFEDLILRAVRGDLIVPVVDLLAQFDQIFSYFHRFSHSPSESLLSVWTAVRSSRQVQNYPLISLFVPQANVKEITKKKHRTVSVLCFCLSSFRPLLLCRQQLGFRPAHPPLQLPLFPPVLIPPTSLFPLPPSSLRQHPVSGSVLLFQPMDLPAAP